MNAFRIFLFFICFHTFLHSVSCIKQGSLSQALQEGRASLRSRIKKGFFHDTFYPQEAPEILILSSPMERKISFVQLNNFEAVGDVVLPILDSGLISPYGIAWDAPRSALYICDGSLQKIFRVKLKAVKCLRECKGIPYNLVTTGNRYTVVENVISQWAAVDKHGSLYFTDQKTNSVNKLPAAVIDMIVEEKVSPKQLIRTTEAEAAGEESAKEGLGLLAAQIFGEDSSSEVTPSIYQFYEKGVCPHVGTPSGVGIFGSELYWGNQIGGYGSGAIVSGKTNPRAKLIGGEDKPTFPSHKVSNATGSAYGVAVTGDKVLFTDASHTLWASSRRTGQTVAMSVSFSQPRGIVWDGDNTVYIADQKDNRIVSMPVAPGLLKENAPVSRTVDISGPFGVAFIGKTDRIWEPLFGTQSSARRSASTHSLLLEFLAGVILIMAVGQITP